MKILLTVLLLFINLISENIFHFKKEIVKRAENKGDNSVWKFTILDENENIKYEFTKNIPFDVSPPAININPKNGDLVISYSFDGFAEIISKFGNNLKQINFFKESEPNYERIILSSINNNSLTFLISSPEMKLAKLQKYNLDCVLNFEKELSCKNALSLFASEEDDFTAISIYNPYQNKLEAETLIFDKQNNIIFSDSGLYEKINFYNNIFEFVNNKSKTTFKVK